MWCRMLSPTARRNSAAAGSRRGLSRATSIVATPLTQLNFERPTSDQERSSTLNCGRPSCGTSSGSSIIGFIAGLIARVLSPGPNEPKGFILTTVLGIAGAFLATFIGQAVGWYRLDQGAGFIGATVGAVIVLFIGNRLVVHRVVADPGVPTETGPPPPGRGV